MSITPTVNIRYEVSMGLLHIQKNDAEYATVVKRGDAFYVQGDDRPYTLADAVLIALGEENEDA